MCQLTYSNLHDARLNSLMVYLLSKIGSEKHDDGCGMICSDNKIWKSAHAARKILNLGDIININTIDDRAIPFHIRMATWGIEVKKENSHPFDGKHFILMHNGTLLPRDGEEPKDKTKDSDSLRFLNALDECKDINPQGTFEEIFNAAMANFAGKFAFIIREKETGIDYIVRGRTAELWISELTFDHVLKGYVINTSKETMKEAFEEFVNVWDLFFRENVEFSEPKLLDVESIFIANDLDIEKIGKSVEITPVKKETGVIVHNGRNEWRGRNDYDYDIQEDKDAIEIIRKAKRVYDFLSDHSLGFIDLQIMFMISGGISLLELTKEDIDFFLDYLMPKISANKKVKEEVKQLLNGQYFPAELYEKGKLEYPWTVNDGNAVVKVLKEYIKEI